jgi:hypothetical protein
MVKKAAKRDPHQRIRFDPKLIARLEKAREANGNTLTGEIVGRLEESFQTEDRMASFKEVLLKQLADHRADWEKRDKEYRDERDAWNVEAKELQKKLIALEGAMAVVDTLFGDDPASKEAIRAIALVIANNPNWAASLESVHKLTLSINAAINTAAAKSATKGE